MVFFSMIVMYWLYHCWDVALQWAQWQDGIARFIQFYVLLFVVMIYGIVYFMVYCIVLGCFVFFVL